MSCRIISECTSKLNGLLTTSEVEMEPQFGFPVDVGVVGRTVCSSSSFGEVDVVSATAVLYEI